MRYGVRWITEKRRQPACVGLMSLGIRERRPGFCCVLSFKAIVVSHALNGRSVPENGRDSNRLRTTIRAGMIGFVALTLRSSLYVFARRCPATPSNADMATVLTSPADVDVDETCPATPRTR